MIKMASSRASESSGASSSRSFRFGGYRVRRNEKGETELHRACINGDYKAAEKLLMKGHPVNEKDNGGWTCLHEACNWGHKEIARLLIEYGANLDAKGMGNITPLLDAAANGQFDIVDLLFNAGASLAALDSEGRTVLDLLENFKRDSDGLCNADEDDYQRITKNLEEKMRRESIPLHRTTNKQQPETSAGRSHRSTRPRCTKAQSGKDFYTSAIESVGRSGSKKAGAIFDYETFSAIRKGRRGEKNSGKAALITENEYEVGDDWMIDDLNGHYIRTVDTEKTKRPRIARDTSPTPSNDAPCSTSSRDSPAPIDFDDCLDPEMTQNVSNSRGTLDNDLAVVAEHPRRRKSPKRHRLRQTRLTVSKTPPLPVYDDFRDISEERNGNGIMPPQAVDTPVPVATSSTTNASVQNIGIIRVNVVISGQKFAVIVDSRTRTVGWLAQKVSSNYEAANGKRPLIRLFTSDDAALSEEDTVEFLFYRNEELYGKVERFDVLPIEDNYRQICQRVKQDPCDDIIALMRNAAQTTSLDLRHASIKSCGGPLLVLKSLQSEYNLTTLYLRGQRLTTPDAAELGITVRYLRHLSDLSISCTGIHCEQMLALSGEMCKEPGKQYALAKLDVSFNMLGDPSAVPLSRILRCCPLLRVLRLQCINATCRFINDHKLEIRESFSSTSLEHLDLSCNRLGESTMELRSILNGLNRDVELKLF